MPFVKGQSGNPGGRPKAIAEVRALAQEQGAMAIERLARIARGKDPKAAVAACRELLDRGFGKSTQPIDGDGEGGPVRMTVTWLPPV